ncbi:MAG: thiamine pyrophosphate-binding protein [Acidimicrobiales bacterium]
MSEKTLPEETLPEETLSEETPSEETLSEETLPEEANAGQALLRVAAAHGTTVFFGVVSIHNQPLIDAVVHGEDYGARFVPVRHEAAAVNAADAYARATGGLGVAITSTGTGAGNAAGSLIEALTAGSRLLHVTGQIDAEFLGQGRGVIHETKDQLAMLQAVSKQAISVTSAGEVGSTLAAAATMAMTPPTGPVSVEIPIDLQYQPTPVPVFPPVETAAPDPASLSGAADLLRAADRPVLWLGGGAVGARAQIQALVDATGAAVVTSNAGRGTIDERSDMVVGNFAATPVAGELLAAADMLVSIGTHFRSNETRHYHLELPTPHIQIDVDPDAIGRAYPASVGIVGDSASVLDALLPLVDTEPNPEWRAKVTATREAVRAQLQADIGPYAALADGLRRTMADDSPFVRDVTIPASAWGNRLVDVYAPETNINARGGGIGQGLSMAAGAAIAKPDAPTVLLVGDGGLAVHLGELGTVAEEQPWLVIVLFNDGGYGVLRNLQDHHFERRSGVDLVGPDFAVLASAFSIEHRHLREPAASAAVLGEAAGLRRPVVVEVDCTAFGPMPKRFVPPVPVSR